jgi:hypothetical protein
MTNSTPATSSAPESPPPSALESLGVLAGILAQAALIPGWSPESFSRAELDGAGTLDIVVRNEDIGRELAARIGLVETNRKAYRPTQLFSGFDTHRLIHIVYREGTFAGHAVMIRAQWETPLADLDLAEGEELA